MGNSFMLGMVFPAANQKTPMFKAHPLLKYLPYSVAAAILYCIPAVIYLRSDAFAASYLLYIGNMLFGLCIAVFIWFYNKRRKENANAGIMIFAGHITAVIGIIIACIICILLLLVFAPDVFHSKPAVETLQNAPAQLQSRNRGFITILFMNAVIGNFSAGSFISLILPYTVKRDQEGGAAQITDEERNLNSKIGK